MYDHYSAMLSCLKDLRVSTAVYFVLEILWLEPSGPIDRIVTRAKNNADFYSGQDGTCGPERLDLRWSVTSEQIREAVDEAIHKRLIFQVAEQEMQMMHNFHVLCGLEYICDPLTLGWLLLTPTGGAIIRNIEDRLRELRPGYPPSEKTPDYDFCGPFDPDRVGVFSNVREYLVASTYAGFQKGLEDCADSLYVQQGDILPIKAWCDRWWNIQYGGFACKLRCLEKS